MAEVLVQDSSLQDIADAIREKNGTETTYLPSEMGDAVREISGGGGVTILSGNQDYCFSYNWEEITNKLKNNEFKFENVTSIINGFKDNGLLSDENLEIEINFNIDKQGDLNSFFRYAGNSNNLINKIKLSGTINCGDGCLLGWFQQANIKEIAVDDDLQIKAGLMQNFLWNAQKIRNINNLLEKIEFVDDNTSFQFMNNFTNMYCLDEIKNVKIWIKNSSGEYFTNNYVCFNNGNYTSNGNFGNLQRIKDFVYYTENNVPIKVKLLTNISITTKDNYGYGNNIKSYYDKLDKEVTDDETYQALKNDPDWFTTNLYYSRYNHDSAVNTINSLPDVSGSSFIANFQFNGNSGLKTDGGAINTLTPEEIAVATTKGWTIGLV